MVSSFLLSAALLQSPSILPRSKLNTAETLHHINSEPPRDTATSRELSQLLLTSDPIQDKITAKFIRSQLYLFVNGLPEQISLPEESTNDEQLRQIEIKQKALSTLISYLPLKGSGIEAKMSTDIQDTFFNTLFKAEGTQIIEPDGDASIYRFIAKAKAVDLALSRGFQTLKIYHGEDNMKQLLLGLESKGLLTEEQRKIIEDVLKRPYKPLVNTSNK